MVDLSQIAGFDWDAGNSGKSAGKHRVTDKEAEEVFVDSRLLLFADEKHSDEEPRYHAYGCTAAGRLLQASFTLRRKATSIRVISARPVSRRERNRYEQET